MDQRTFEIKVKELAEKLKSSGVVTSDTMARSMAQDIIRTEESAKEKYEQPKQEQQEKSSSAPSSDAPRNMVIEEAIKNAQGAAHEARVGADVDQSKSIAELLEEDTERQEQPKVTLDNPVVENGSARKEVETTPADFGIEQTPADKRGSGAPSVDITDLSDDKTPQGVTVPEMPAESTAQPQQSAAPQHQDVEKQTEQAEPVQQEQKPAQEQPQEKDQPKVDLSEMFNFSKK